MTQVSAFPKDKEARLRGLSLDLPLPPSVNRMTAKLGNRSPSVVRWIKLADDYVMANRIHHSLNRIVGAYILTITWPEKQFGKFDCDNRVKILSDYLERLYVIENDKLCWKLVVQWGDVEKDWCRVELQSREES